MMKSAALVCALAATMTAHAQGPDGIDEDADDLLQRMSDYLGDLREFSVVSSSFTDVVTKEGQKISFPAMSKVEVKRPNRLRSDRISANADLTLFYNGSKIALQGHRKNMYAVTDAPKNLDAAIDFARDKLGLEAPAADLLYSDAYAALTEDVLDGFIVGREFIDGVPVQHLAFRGREVDFQIWIEDGPRPLPRRFIITSKKVTGAPDFEVQLSDWDVDAALPNDRFTFVPPRDATRIDFLGARQLKDSSRRTP